MDISRLCYNCFKEKPDSSGPCPYCGFDLEENAKKYPVALRAGTVLNGRYLIGRVLGQGGFGITYLAWDQKLGARVAVKEYMPGEMAARVDGTTVSVMSEARTEDFSYGKERFSEEARTLAKFMGQPNIAGVTDYFDENDTSYFVMDYIEGISFKTYIANQGGKVSVEEALDVMIPVLRALTAVHGEGFIHRDVTPDNIYITKDGNVKLLDFGSARYSIGDKSKSLDVILKVGYAPKEQYTRRGRQGPYTDVYSCAACLYAAITGFLPPESLDRLEQDTLVPPSEAGVEIPLYLERAILKGLAVQPDDRFQTAGEFLEALENQQVVELPGERNENLSAAAPAASAAEKKKRPIPMIAGAAAAVLLVFAAGTYLGRGSAGTNGAGNAAGGGIGAGNGIEAGNQKEAGLALENDERETAAPTVLIAGEEYSAAAEEVDLSGKNLTDGDLEGLKEMTNLKSLNLQDNSEISDLTSLAGLTSLEKLILPCPSQIHDLSPLSGLTELKTLYLPGNWDNLPSACEIEDFSPLSDLTKLETLVMIVEDLSNLSFLSNMTQLKRLQLSGTVTAEDLTPLAGLSNLKDLSLDTYGLQSIKGMEGLENLESLEIYDLMGCPFVEDLSSLSGLTKLKELRFRVSGQLYDSDLASLSGLTELEVLETPGGGGKVGLDLTPLSGMKKLTSLRTGCNVLDLTPLAGLTNLTSLDLSNGGFGSTSDYVEFESLEPLSGLTNLTSLTLRNKHISDLSPLSGLTNLQSLTLHNAGSVTDVSPLSALPDLKSLTISGTWREIDTSSLSQVSIIHID